MLAYLFNIYSMFTPLMLYIFLLYCILYCYVHGTQLYTVHLCEERRFLDLDTSSSVSPKASFEYITHLMC